MRTRARGRTKEGERKSDRGEERDARNESASSGGRPGCSAVFSLQLGGARERSRGVRAIALNFPFSRFSHPPAFARARTLPVCLLFLSLLAPSSLSLSQCVYIYTRAAYTYIQLSVSFIFSSSLSRSLSLIPSRPLSSSGRRTREYSGTVPPRLVFHRCVFAPVLFCFSLSIFTVFTFLLFPPTPLCPPPFLSSSRLALNLRPSLSRDIEGGGAREGETKDVDGLRPSLSLSLSLSRLG